MTDLDRFLSLLEGLRQAIAVVERYRGTIARDRLVRDVDTQNMVLFALYRAVQSAIDLGYHLVAERGLPIPASYREVFTVLAEATALDAELAERLAGWGGLRNVIAHHYTKLDIELIATALYDELDDLAAFHRAMVALVPDA